jgi:sulfoxide reductase catalytic subunit YedY
MDMLMKAAAGVGSNMSTNSSLKSRSNDRITPPEVYFNRRNFLKAGMVAAAVVSTAVIYRRINDVRPPTVEQPLLAGLEQPTTAASGYPSELVKAFHTDEAKTPFQSITHYNNFYEFSTDKDGVADAIGSFSAKGWKLAVDGLVARPAIFEPDDIRKVAPPEERVYRMRCVEAWSMVIPWAGYSLAKLLERVQPLSAAKYVAFTTLLDSRMMPGQRSDVLDWPYVEGLRMDEAMHPLTLLTTGLYGRELPVQDGAPVRIVIPWKYGFKGIKSIVKISLVAEQPPTSWNRYGPSEYGFYANVNPNHPHPRWSQATENRIGEGRRPTLMFNGYGEQVAGLYAGMDLDRYY